MKHDNLLTQREVEYLNLAKLGLTDYEISDKMRVSYNTVTSHRNNVNKKLKGGSKFVNVRIAVKMKLIIY